MRNSRTRSYGATSATVHTCWDGTHLYFVRRDNVRQSLEVFDKVVRGCMRIDTDAPENLEGLKCDSAARLLPGRRPESRAHELGRCWWRMLATTVDNGDAGDAMVVDNYEISALGERARTTATVVLQTKFESQVSELRDLPKTHLRIPRSDAVEGVLAVGSYETFSALTTWREAVFAGVDGPRMGSGGGEG